MLYVFHVDEGRMLKLEMRLAVNSVLQLQEQIELIYKIPLSEQVLLASGGECLDSNARVCTYSAGTDTNPIFLFRRKLEEGPPKPKKDEGPPPTDIDALNETFFEDMIERVRGTQDLPPVYQTVVVRCQIATQFHEMAVELAKECEQLVHDQHLQKQGWSAVIANLEDITYDVQRRVEGFERNFKEYLEECEAYAKLVESYDEDLKILGQIPILPALLAAEGMTECDFETSCVTKSPEQKETSTAEVGSRTLLDWIASSDKSSMEQIYKNCTEGLTKYDDNMFQMLKEEIKHILKMIDNPEMKEVKGIGDRLFTLDQLLSTARKLVQEQSDLAQSFQQNQARAGNLGDTSVLPDLCSSHRKQLLVMLQNHENICDIRRRCGRAKRELSLNIDCRLKWIVAIENRIVELNQCLMMHSANIMRLKRQFNVLRQIHLAPTIYIASVSEVVRRRAFSQAFLLFASDMACQLLTIYNDEVTRRKEFQAQFDGHFLNSLFPGMEDMPPSYATQAPSIFDSGLPKLTVDDVVMLKEELPVLTEHLIIPDNVAAPVFPIVKYKNENDKVDDGVVAVEEKLVQVVSEVGLASNLDQNFLKPVESETVIPTTAHGLPHLKDLDKGCESETDTEEFEKVGQSPLDLNFDKEIPSPKPSKQDASTCTEVGEKSPIPPKKPPRSFQKLQIHHEESVSLQRTLSVSSSNTDSFTNVKIDEFSSRNYSSNTTADSCFNSHHQQMQSGFLRSKSLSPHTPQSPRDCGEYVISPTMLASQQQQQQLGHQPVNEFATDEFYIDESLPSSLSIETGHSHGEFVRQLDTANNVVAMLQDNLETSRTEQDKLKLCLKELADLSRDNIKLLRTELKELQKHVQDNKSDVLLNFSNLTTSFQNLLLKHDSNEREIIEGLNAEHDIQIMEYKMEQHQRSVEKKSLEEQIVYLDDSLKKASEDNEFLKSELAKVNENCERRVGALESRVKEVLEEKERAVKETTDRLCETHKNEIERLRSHFKYVMSDRSPSQVSIEKFDFKDDSQAKHTKAELDEAVAQETKKWQRTVEQIQIQHYISLEDVRKQITDKKDQEIVALREQVESLIADCKKYKNAIQKISDRELLRRIDLLEREKSELQLQVDGTRQQPLTDLAASVAVVEGEPDNGVFSSSQLSTAGRIDVATSPLRQHRETLTRSHSSAIRPCSVSLNSCQEGDLVLVVWSQKYETYVIHQESRYLYFLNSDCIKRLGLKEGGADQTNPYCIGEVESKEYCCAKKNLNRYKVPKGTTFYRVKVSPIKRQQQNVQATPSSQTSQMTQSQTTTDSAAIQDVQLACSSASQSVPATPTRVTPSVAESTTATPSTTTVAETSTATPATVAESLTTVQESRLYESTAESVLYGSSLESLPEGAASSVDR